MKRIRLDDWTTVRVEFFDYSGLEKFATGKQTTILFIETELRL